MSEPATDNPLLHPTGAFSFESFEPSHVVPAITHHITRGRAAIDAIAESHAPQDATPTWDSTMGALERACFPLDWAGTLVAHLDSVCASDALRDAYAEVRPEISAFYTDIPVHAGLHAALQRFAASPEAKTLDPVRARALQKTLDDFRRHGASLSPEDKSTLVEIGRSLSSLTHTFSQHVLDATAAFALWIDDERRLDGIPAHVLETARLAAREADREGWKLTLHAPCVVPALTYATDRALRETLWRAYNRRAAEGELNNAPLILEILKLRRQKSKLLGYQDFADLVLEDRMARSGAAASTFVEELHAHASETFARERAALEAFARDEDGPDVLPLQPWDVSFYAERLRKARYDFDGEALRPYFSLTSVLQGMFDVASRLYGVEIAATDSLEVWHPSVRTYVITEGDAVLGHFFADLHPRDDKRGGAWMHGLSFANEFPDGSLGHLGLIAANITDATEDGPALLTHGEVETLFHEFGHLLHHLLTTVEVRSLAGTNVAWDFVELPSQIMENWCWHRDALGAFARHHATHAELPEDLFGRLLKSRTFRGASAMMRQLGFATLDLHLHRTDAVLQQDSSALLGTCRRVLGPFSTAPLPEDESMICGFSHLFSGPTGYAAGYYSYKWAEVLDADAFSAFESGGVFSREVGERFRRCILARGDAAEPQDLFHDFLGRAPSVNALLRRSGIEARA